MLYPIAMRHLAMRFIAPHQCVLRPMAIHLALLITLSGLLLSACATHETPATDPYAAVDPFEKVNRTIFAFNDGADRLVLRPAAKVYGILPPVIRQRVSNFFANLYEPYTFVNDVLQGEAGRAGTSLARFSINSTIGVIGLFDPASTMGLIGHREDFGQTLGVYGIGGGPYIVLPLLGPSNLRDGVGLISQNMLNANVWSSMDVDGGTYATAFAINVLDKRERSLKLVEEVRQTSVDYYATVRSFYIQRRESEVLNGRIDIDDLPDIDDIDDMDDMGDFDDMNDMDDMNNMDGLDMEKPENKGAMTDISAIFGMPAKGRYLSAKLDLAPPVSQIPSTVPSAMSSTIPPALHTPLAPDGK